MFFKFPVSIKNIQLTHYYPHADRRHALGPRISQAHRDRRRPLDRLLLLHEVERNNNPVQVVPCRAQAGRAPGDEPTHFHFGRDCDTVKVQQEVSNASLLVLDQGMACTPYPSHAEPNTQSYSGAVPKVILSIPASRLP